MLKQLWLYRLRWLCLSLFVLIADKATKMAAAQWLDMHQAIAIFPGMNLLLLHNKGAAFSLLSDAGGWQRWFFITTTIGISCVLLIWLYRLEGKARYLAIAIALILGGAAGNLVDRLLNDGGYVIDFIQLYYKTWAWPTFNIADSAITIGAVMLIFDSVKNK